MVFKNSGGYRYGLFNELVYFQVVDNKFFVDGFIFFFEYL